MGQSPSLSELRAVATDAAYAGGRRTLAYFNTNVEVETKSDNTPVTRADREAEAIIRQTISRHYPTHAILGEETGEDATLLTTNVTRSQARSDAYDRLVAKTKLHRTWGDCYGYVLVATGRAEIMLDAAMNAWDCAPLLPILTEAGGRFTTWAGEVTIYPTRSEPIRRCTSGSWEC